MQPGNGQPARMSALGLPYGTGTLLDHLVQHCRELECQHVYVVGSAQGLEANTFASGPPFTRAAGMSEAVASLEPSDTVLVLDPRHWPGRHGEMRSIIQGCEGEFCATHVLPVGAGQSRVIERLERDRDDRVCRIRRLYEPKTWVNERSPVVAYSILPARLLRDLECACLRDLRLALVRRGIPTRDRTIATPVVDLADARSQLMMAEFSVAEAGALDVLPDHYSRLSLNVLVGRGALVHGTARIIGPAVIQPGSVIEADALIVGPALIGENCVVRRSALIARSLAMPESEVPSGATVFDRVVSDAGAAQPAFAWDASRHEPVLSRDESGLQTSYDDRTDRIKDQTPSRRGYFMWKRASDFVLALIGLIVLSPLLLVIAILIKVDSRGPVVFVHRREGRGGREFPCFKFRSMRRDADRLQRQLYANNVVDGPQFKLDTDPRVTRFGRILRQANLDELPQLFNVLLGHVSFVGPRPSPFRENQICVPWRQARLSVRPGITGLWQLCRSPNRSQGDFQEWIYYDLIYVRRMSAWLDFKILLATVLTLGGQYRVPLRWLTSSSHRLPRLSSMQGRRDLSSSRIFRQAAGLHERAESPPRGGNGDIAGGNRVNGKSLAPSDGSWNGRFPRGTPD
jgi:lipopolysaccharide/colanic/teichoic acid biosynthesis glycosyltransferase